METRFYPAQGLDIERIAIELEKMFLIQGYQVQHFGNLQHTVVQFKKGGDFAAIVGMQAALTLTLQTNQGGVMAVIGQQKWADKAAAGAVGMLLLWPLAFTAGAGAIRQSNLSNQLLSALDAVVHQQNAAVQASPVPLQMLPPQVQQQVVASAPPPPISHTPQAPPPPPPQRAAARQPLPPPQYAPAPPPPAKTLKCPACATSNAEDDLYCARCGRPLAAQPATCPQCGSPIKPDAAFCTKCGTSFVPPKQVTELTSPGDMTPKTQVVSPEPVVGHVWGYLTLASGSQLELTASRITIGRTLPGSGEGQPEINLYDFPQSGTVSRLHAVIELTADGPNLTDLNSTNLTRLNGVKLTPHQAVPLVDGSACEFGQVKCTFTLHQES